VKIVQSRSRNAYTKSLQKVVRRSNIRVLYKDDDNHWIEGSEGNREDLTHAMVSHYATALTIMTCRNINEPTIHRDIMRLMNRPTTDVKSSGENTSKPAAKKLGRSRLSSSRLFNQCKIIVDRLVDGVLNRICTHNKPV
jgi:hypothetical protein